MNNAPGGIRIFLANLAWLISCLPGWFAFHIATHRLRQAQTALLSRILKANARTDYGKKHGFASIASPEEYALVPMTDYEDYADEISKIKYGDSNVLTTEPVDLFHPTSGSTSPTKFIPYTRTLRRQFSAAINPWIASLYLAHPSLLLGRHYWSISPTTPYPKDPTATIRIGFADDSEYLGAIQRSLARALFPVPPEIARVFDHAAFEYLTLLFLCRERNLRLISVWHPSFLTILIKALPPRLPSIIRDIASGVFDASLPLDANLRDKLSSSFSADPARAKELDRIDLAQPAWPQAIWPGLKIVSCWKDGISEPWVSDIAAHFPEATIQGKGLTATEGIVTFPLGRSAQKICAIRSHFFEFIGTDTGKAYHVWNVEEGREYAIVVTTGGGLYRYRLHDLVRITGFYHQMPCLDFISRDNLVSDVVGEKLNAKHVEEAIRRVEKALACNLSFAMLAPVQNSDIAGYVLFLEIGKSPEPDYQKMADQLENELSTNYHYLHARQLDQLRQVRIFRIAKGAEVIYRRHLIRKGIKTGDIKFQSLSADLAWINEFPGEYVGQSTSA